MLIDSLLFTRGASVQYRVVIGQKYQGGATAYEITSTDKDQARAFLLGHVTDASTKVELTISASGDDAYRLLGAEPPTLVLTPAKATQEP